jgi:hypothetical protein
VHAPAVLIAVEASQSFQTVEFFELANGGVFVELLNGHGETPRGSLAIQTPLLQPVPTNIKNNGSGALDARNLRGSPPLETPEGEQ